MNIERKNLVNHRCHLHLHLHLHLPHLHSLLTQQEAPFAILSNHSPECFLQIVWVLFTGFQVTPLSFCITQRCCLCHHLKLLQFITPWHAFSECQGSPFSNWKLQNLQCFHEFSRNARSSWCHCLLARWENMFTGNTWGLNWYYIHCKSEYTRILMLCSCNKY